MKAPKPPTGLRSDGRLIWSAIVEDAANQGIELDAKELIWLRQAALLADTIARMEGEMATADLIVPGHAKQPVAQPLLAELRMSRALLGQLLARIRLDIPDEQSAGLEGPNRFRDAAISRWSRQRG